MAALSNSAEGGTSGTAVTTGNSGGASGDAWNTVNTGTGATVNYDNSQAAHGGLSYTLATGGTAVAVNLIWSGVAASPGTTLFFRFYVNYSSLGSGINPPIFRLRSNTAVQIIRLFRDTAGVLNLANSANSTIGSFTSGLSINTWYRVEVSVNVTAGSVTVDYYLGDSTTPVEASISVTGQALGALGVDEITFGQIGALASLPTFWLDDLGYSDTAALGPVSVVVGQQSTSRHPGRGPSNARFLQTPRSTDPPAQFWTIDGTLAGVGTLLAGVVQTEVTTATLAGTGTLTAGVVQTEVTTATLAGVGTLTAAVVQTEVASATLAGTGTLTAAVVQTEVTTATLAGTGTLTAGTSQVEVTTATLAGVGTLVASAGPGPATATLAGVGSLIADLTLVPIPRVWLFIPPQRRHKTQISGALYYSYMVSFTTWKDSDGVWRSQETPLHEELLEAQELLAVSGRPQIVDDQTASELIAAGIGTLQHIALADASMWI